MFIRYHLPTLLWALFIMIICAIPGDKIPKLSFLEWLKPDKIVHILVFSVLSILLLRTFLDAKTLNWNEKSIAVFSIVLSSAYGILVEILQYFVFINRSGDVRDAIANTIGAIIGWWIYKRFFRETKSKLKA
jgi:VanZ family protein